MPHALVPSDGVAAPARFIRSVVRPRPSALPAINPADAELAEAHGFKDPEPPKGTDPRLWCTVHHRPMRILGFPGNRHIWCAQCAPSIRNPYTQSVGLECAARGCATPARWDVYGVPICGERCLERIGAGCRVRVPACALRVVGVRSESGGTMLFACFPDRRRSQSVRLLWWQPQDRDGREVRLRWPKVRREQGAPYVTVVTDQVLAHFFRRLAYARVREARPVVRRLIRWEAGRGPCPWMPATLQPVLDRLAAHRAGLVAMRQIPQSG